MLCTWRKRQGDGGTNGEDELRVQSEDTSLDAIDEDRDRILLNLEGDAAFLSTPSVKDLKRKHEGDSRRLVILKLHKATLGEYYKSNRIPRGMRSTMRPNLFSNNDLFCTRFMQLSNQYARDVILLNIDFLHQEIQHVSERIITTEESLKSLLTEEEMSRYRTSLVNMLSKFQSEQEEIKRRKWHRDMDDYHTGKIYNWQFSDHKQNGQFPKNDTKKRKRQTSRPKSPSDNTSFLEDVPKTPDPGKDQPEGVEDAIRGEKSPQAKISVTSTRSRNPKRKT
ncbi:uncharacterized protein [Engystomops pustulosus]|uniref:uncharacterized protein n=1 Tax=Engystomops pustulosus TaxID=76066 RepID=UPI003AFAF8B0